MEAGKIPLKQSASGVYLIPDKTALLKLSQIQLCSVLNRIRQNYMDLIFWSESEEPFCVRCLNPNSRLMPDNFWENLGFVQPDKKGMNNYYMCRHCEEFFKVYSENNGLKANIDILKGKYDREVQKNIVARTKAKCDYSRKKREMSLRLSENAKLILDNEKKLQKKRAQIIILKAKAKLQLEQMGENKNLPKIATEIANKNTTMDIELDVPLGKFCNQSSHFSIKFHKLLK